MIETTQKFKEIMSSNIRPQNKVLIKLYAEHSEGENIYLWQSKDIINFEYERKVDPLGRENPQIIFKWKERYKGAKNIYGEALKYQNLKVGFKVELSILQSLDFKSRWSSVFNASKKWKDFFDNNKTWKNVFQESVFEEIKLPTVFLYALPKYSEDTIEWEARDVLSFMNKNWQFYSLIDISNEPTPIKDLSKYLMENSYDFNIPMHLKNTILKSVDNAEVLNYYDVEACLIDEPMSDALRKIIFAFGGYHCDFNIDGSLKFKSILNQTWFEITGETIKRKIMYKEPTLIKPVGINRANIRWYNHKPSYSSPKVVKNEGFKGEEYEYYTTFIYPEYATAYDKNGNLDYKIISELPLGNQVWFETLTDMQLESERDYGEMELTVYPIKIIGEMMSFNNNGGFDKIYEEDNNLNVIDPEYYDIEDRISAIFDYFAPKKTENSVEVPNMEIVIAGNPSIETGDVYIVEGTVANGEKVYFNELVVYHKIEYKGSIKSNLKTHGMGVI
jgi:hypothetical protein